eukprot:TRINITY_DN2975_c0_g1_i1.p1 TRINITY_DN2975_c0_g1~~TRINITY_DN2975_c0_g1_i1.p1  ORF type:complete len:389 (-),score=99.10 TRINITY_DN2975_c0_g1_i1:57-1223(-)
MLDNASDTPFLHGTVQQQAQQQQRGGHNTVSIDEENPRIAARMYAAEEHNHCCCSTKRQVCWQTLLWAIAAIFLTIIGVLQVITGPSYPIKDTVSLGSTSIHYNLDRAHTGLTPHTVKISIADQSVMGVMRWRQHHSQTFEWNTTIRERNGDDLTASIPAQDYAVRCLYEIALMKEEQNRESERESERGREKEIEGKIISIIIPDDPINIRWKDDLPDVVLIIHIIFMASAFLFSCRAALEMYYPFSTLKSSLIYSIITVILIIVGGFVMGPLVLHYCFHTWWTGIPIGWDITDNKTVVALVIWLIVLFITIYHYRRLSSSSSPSASASSSSSGYMSRVGEGEEEDDDYERERKAKLSPVKGWYIFAGVLTFIVFIIPHSLFGTESYS